MDDDFEALSVEAKLRRAAPGTAQRRGDNEASRAQCKCLLPALWDSQCLY